MTQDLTQSNTFWLKLRELSFEASNMLNGGLFINLTSNKCILEFRNLNSNKRCVEIMQIEIKEHFIQIEFEVTLNFSDLILEDVENLHFCFLEKRVNFDIKAVLAKMQTTVDTLGRFSWTLEILEEIGDVLL